ncbi:hypothetical protein [Deinococcus aquaedulcis]|uniref:hypothetical protein n=1 Tax=Deinococcus aquaedulcis TaxID=2840455 RepID=UPI001C82E3FA|nr:hypothetical protein [Deinococcus aquaedulcis]
MDTRLQLEAFDEGGEVAGFALLRESVLPSSSAAEFQWDSTPERVYWCPAAVLRRIAALASAYELRGLGKLGLGLCSTKFPAEQMGLLAEECRFLQQLVNDQAVQAVCAQLMALTSQVERHRSQPNRLWLLIDRSDGEPVDEAEA